MVGFDGRFVGDGLYIEIIYFDVDLVEVFVACSNTKFSGGATMYFGHDRLQEFADALRGFPTQTSDSVNFELGNFVPNHVGGGMRFYLSCVSISGHMTARVQLQGKSCEPDGQFDSVSLQLPVEAHGIDSFVRELTGMKLKLGTTAFLPMVERAN